MGQWSRQCSTSFSLIIQSPLLYILPSVWVLVKIFIFKVKNVKNEDSSTQMRVKIFFFLLSSPISKPVLAQSLQVETRLKPVLLMMKSTVLKPVLLIMKSNTFYYRKDPKGFLPDFILELEMMKYQISSTFCNFS